MNIFTYRQKGQNNGQSEQIFLKRKWKEKIVPACRSVRHAGREDDRCCHTSTRTQPSLPRFVRLPMTTILYLAVLQLFRSGRAVVLDKNEFVEKIY